MDGRTSTTNNQGSWLGEGFGYEPGYIERQYKPCQDDGHDNSGDLCWSHDNVMLMLNGNSSQLVRDGESWRFASDDGSRIERLTGTVNGDNDGEYWKVTTTDGTQYFFGLNRLPGWSAGGEETASAWTVPIFGDDSGEPCYQSTFANAHCQQGWRWNLDHVKDLHGNVMSYFYGQETNAYALGLKTDVAGASYIRGGWLKRIDYGQRDGAVYTTSAAARVVFDTAERCLPTSSMDCAPEKLTEATAAAWPDVPFDRNCAVGSKCAADQASPTFWTRKRVTAITTQIRSGSAWSPVDTWTLGHLFTDNADGSRTLWLNSITHQGVAGGGESVAMPSVRLDGLQLANRIDRAGDNVAPLIRPRLAVVYTDAGGRVDVNYAPADCSAGALPTPGASTKRCFPVIWHPGGAKDPVTDWFHKYVVASVIETDATTVAAGTAVAPDMVTSYEYLGDAAWRHAEADGISDPEYLTWSEWRGYERVRVREGDGTKMTTLTEHTYLRGMNGDQSPGGGTRSVTRTDSTGGSHVDDNELAGFEIESATFNGAQVVTKTITSPWRYETAAQTWSWGTDRAYLIRPRTTRTLTALASGGWRETRSTTTYDPQTSSYPDPVGRATQVEDLGDVSDPGDDQCTRTSYADNQAVGLRTLVSGAETVAVACSVTPDRATQVISHGRTWYDGLSFGAAPVRGDPTRTEKLAGHDGTTATFVTVAAATFDAYGRPLTSTDANGATTTTAYTETDGLTTRKVESSPEITVGTATTSFAATTEYAPQWGQPAAQVDWNGKRTELVYDALGRLSGVWLPNRSKALGQTPNFRYTYTIDGVHPTSVRTERIKISGEYESEYQVYDGFLRPRQTQAPGTAGGRLVTDTFYTATGQVAKANDTYYAAGAPAGDLLPVTDGDVDLQMVYAYDGADRVTDTITLVAGQERWRTVTSYGGDRVHIDPPAGGTPTTTISDARGRTVEVRHYSGAGPAGDFEATGYAYTPGGLLSQVVDPSGNTWSYGYDQRGRKTWAEDPDAGRTTLGYDDRDLLTSTTDARGVTVSSVYDVLGRQTATYQGDPVTGTKLSVWVYDTLLKGQLSYSSRYVNGQAYTVAIPGRDEFYRALRIRYSIPADGGALKGTYTFNTAYNRDGTVQSITLPDVGDTPGEGIVYSYDDLGQMTGISGYAGGFKYDLTGELLQVALNAGGKSVWVTNRYEEGTDRLATTIVARQSTTTAPRPTSDVNQTYTYDPAGNVLSIADTPASGDRDVQCFTNDHLRRMTEAWTTASQTDDPCAGGPASSGVGGVAAYHQAFTYDAAGNRLTESTMVSDQTAGTVTRDYTYPTAAGSGGEADGGDGAGSGGGAGQSHALRQVVEHTTGGDRLSTFGYD
ncbi:MAG: hypothetical protein JXA67_14635, partial [Micromonosporaceae bacterium]|nr:hypothetical protein [Micromonosporaceae bacterium]